MKYWVGCLWVSGENVFECSGTIAPTLCKPTPACSMLLAWCLALQTNVNLPNIFHLHSSPFQRPSKPNKKKKWKGRGSDLSNFLPWSLRERGYYWVLLHRNHCEEYVNGRLGKRQKKMPLNHKTVSELKNIEQHFSLKADVGTVVHIMVSKGFTQGYTFFFLHSSGSRHSIWWTN